MISEKKIKLYIKLLAAGSFIFAILNPSIDIAILVPLGWYFYLWEKEFKKENSFKYYKIFKYTGIVSLIIVIGRTIHYNITY